MSDFITLITAATLNVAIQGEWSYLGECNEKRHKFTSTGDYFVLRNKKNGWKQTESASFDVENNIIILGEQNTDDTLSFRIEKITPSYMSFCSLEVKTETWDCDPSFYMERCADRE